MFADQLSALVLQALSDKILTASLGTVSYCLIDLSGCFFWKLNLSFLGVITLSFIAKDKGAVGV